MQRWEITERNRQHRLAGMLRRVDEKRENYLTIERREQVRRSVLFEVHGVSQNGIQTNRGNGLENKLNLISMNGT